MNISAINDALGEVCKINAISMTEYEIVSGAIFSNGDAIKIHVVQENNKWYLTDKKETLRYMNEVYDLKAPDVKHCITAVIKIYGFSIVAGCLRAELNDETTIANKFFDYIMCIGQLTNMYAFFDKPE